VELFYLPLDHFKVHGPNGDHISFVYPVLAQICLSPCFVPLQIRAMT
jgi:hypothetical protein